MLLVEHRDAPRSAVGRDVVSRDGWPIVYELAALNDRLDHINPDQPACRDLTDLARWIHDKMTTPAPTTNVMCPLPQLLRTQAAQHPDASDRLAKILERGMVRPEDGDIGALAYLQDLHRQTAARDVRLPGGRAR